MRLIDADALIDRIKNPYEQAQVARWVNEQPTIEPEKRTEKRTETHACDCISRQAAIDALNEYFARIGKLKRRGLTKGEKAISLDTVGVIKTLPSVQPEIIRCKNCAKREYCRTSTVWAVLPSDDWFCGDAEPYKGEQE